MTSFDAGDSFRVMPTNSAGGDDLDHTTEVDDDESADPDTEMGDWILDELPQAMRVGDPDDDEYGDRRALAAAEFRKRFEERYFEMECSDAEIAAVAEIIDFAVGVVATANPGYRNTLRGMLAVMHERGGIAARRRAVVGHVQKSMTLFSEAKDEDEKNFATAMLFASLPTHGDDRFQGLNFKKARVELSRSGEQLANPRGAVRIAAALAVSVGAFGDDDEEKSRKAFYEAVKVSV